jgi:hypothetical protein
MGKENRISVELGTRLGGVITPATIEEDPSDRERKQLLDVAKQASFVAQDETWRHVRDINTEIAGSEDEKLLCGFAPSSALLHQSYQGAALEFFKVARSQSGYGPQAGLLLKWAGGAHGADRQRAVLRYIISGRQGRALAQAMRGDFPTWVPQPLERLLSEPLLGDWPDEDKKRLLIELGGHELLHPTEDAEQPEPAPEVVLGAIHNWWTLEGADERDTYAAHVYPESFSPSGLRETSDRVGWFTMFALACFQSFGRTQDEQHRSFIEAGWRDGWWLELAESRPPDDVQSWLDRLKSWSGPEQFYQNFLTWRRSFVDLYTLTRWLDVYIELICKLPRMIEERGPISLNDILQPSYSPVVMRLGLDAAPLNRSLGAGMNWMIRELLRQGVYQPRDESLMAPYCWASSQRVRDLLNALGAGVNQWADTETTRSVYKFVLQHIGVERARFAGDFDLPLQLITRGRNRIALQRCFEVAECHAPNFGDADDA